MLNHSACFRRFLRRPISRQESNIIEFLEHQRTHCGRVRAYINDPLGSLTPLLINYIRWHQQRLTARDALIISPQKPRQQIPALRHRHLSARSHLAMRGNCQPISQILLFGADKYGRNLNAVIAAAASFLAGQNSIFIIVGNALSKSRFSELFYHWKELNEFFITLNSDSVPPDPKPKRILNSILNLFFKAINAFSTNILLKPPRRGFLFPPRLEATLC